MSDKLKCQMCGRMQPSEIDSFRSTCVFCHAMIVRPQFPVSLEDALAKCVELQSFVDWFETENVRLRQIVERLIEAGEGKCGGAWGQEKWSMRVEKWKEEAGAITMEQFLAFDHHAVFAHGMTTDDSAGLHMTGSGQTLYWVAVKGAINDWAMYCGIDSDFEYIRRFGDKVFDTDNITRVLKVSPAVLDLYRGY